MGTQVPTRGTRKYRGLAVHEFNAEAKVVRQLRQDLADMLPYKDKLVAYMKKVYGDIPLEALEDSSVREAFGKELSGVLLIISKCAGVTNTLVRAQFGISAIDAAINVASQQQDVHPSARRIGDNDFIIPGEEITGEDSDEEETDQA